MLPGSTRRRPTTPDNGGGDLRVRQLQLGVVDVGGILLDRGLVLRNQRGLRIQLLFRNRVGRDRALVALQIELRVIQQSLIARQRAFGQIQLNLIRPGVDLGQDLSRLHQIAFVEIHFHQLAVDPRLDRYGVEGGHVAQPVQVDRDGGARDFGNHDWYRACGCVAASPATVVFVRGGDGMSGAPHRVARDTRQDQQN